MNKHICTICGGRGKRCFYNVNLDTWEDYKCWTCNGMGYTMEKSWQERKTEKERSNGGSNSTSLHSHKTTTVDEE